MPSLEDQIAQIVDPALFTRLCNTLFTAEFGNGYQVVDGTRGDDGNDGWLRSENRMLAIYCPIKRERRTDKDYREKAVSDLRKAADLRIAGKYDVKRWSFVTPRKLTNGVLVAMVDAGDEVGIAVNHVESTYLAGLLLKHQHLLKDFPELHVSQLEEKLDKLLGSSEVKKPKPSRDPEHDIFNHVTMRKIAEKDASLKEIFDLRESRDPQAAKRALRALFYSSTDPLIQVNAVMGLIALFDPMTDSLPDFAGLCEAARGPARRMDSKSAESYLVAQRGYYQSFEFGHLLVERYLAAEMEQRVGMSLELPGAAEQRQKRLEQLSKAYAEAFRGALDLANESQSGPATAAVLISIGNAAGQRAMALMQTGPQTAFENERDVCKRCLLAAKDIYAQLGDEHEVANALMNLANQIRFLGEVEEAKELVKAVLPVAEKVGDDDLLKKARLLEERLRTGKIPDYMKGEKSGLRR